jgi:hypothetical protein
MVSFTWKKKKQNININTLQELKKTLIKIKLEDINREINENIIKRNLLQWVENNFSKELILITHLRKALKEYTPQQIRETLIRELGKIREVE